MRATGPAITKQATSILLGATLVLGAGAAHADWTVAQAKPAPPAGAAPATQPANVEAARQAYDRGTAAFDAKRYPEAAREFARADELSPNPVALESALEAATLGDQALLALELSDRADARPQQEAVAIAARKARERFAASAGRLAVRCRPSEPCRARVNGEPVQVGSTRWVLAGVHSIEIESARGREAFTVQISGGAGLTWDPPPPPELPPGEAAARRGQVQLQKPAEERSGISPAFFWIAVSATAVAAGFTVWSGMETLDHYDAFQEGNDSAKTEGRAAQLRTNVLLGVTGVLALGTAAVGIWAVDWGPKEQRGGQRQGARVAVTPMGAVLRFQH